MLEIKLLSEDLINKIAAGEVIERPASVVKELIENSLDAKATSITIEIKNYGKDLIKVSDNGPGMTPSDAEKSILRHATSKIKTAEDLSAINTLGFRGEALASIAAVSHLSIFTKQRQDLAGYQVVVNGGLVVKSGIAAGSDGTAVEVKNLFFNTPARKKFLKTDAVELRQIIQVVNNYSLLNYCVAVKLFHDGRELLNCPVAENLRYHLASIYGADLAKEMIEVSYQNQQLKISGLTVKPYHVRNDKNHQSIFVNGRWVKNEDISQAVYDAYHSLLMVNKHPVFVLDLQLDPHSIDVNVHPTKLDIKIEQKELVCSAITQAVKQALAKENLLPEVNLTVPDLAFSVPSPKKAGLLPKYAFDFSQQTVLKETSHSNDYDSTETASIKSIAEGKRFIVPEPNYLAELSTHSTLSPLKLLGQIHKTFFAAETTGGMFLIDQHAVHERVLYEQFLEQYLEKKVVVQNLLQPLILEVQTSDVEVIIENLELLNGLGFELSEFGPTSFLIKTIPAIFDKLPAEEMVNEIIDKWGKRGLDAVKEEIITRMACRSAVMAGEELTILEMDGILKELVATKLPFTCPHGRPTMIKVSLDELEKKFRRR